MQRPATKHNKNTCITNSAGLQFTITQHIVVNSMTQHITLNDIKKRLSEIKAEKSRLEEEERALGIVLNTFFPPPPQATQNKPAKKKVSDSNRTLLVDDVRSLFPSLGNREFTVADVFDELTALGKPPADKNKVSMVLSKLLIKEEVIAVKKGVGRSPSVYKVARIGEQIDTFNGLN